MDPLSIQILYFCFPWQGGQGGLCLYSLYTEYTEFQNVKCEIFDYIQYSELHRDKNNREEMPDKHKHS